jgi:hypothetical protein
VKLKRLKKPESIGNKETFGTGSSFETKYPVWGRLGIGVLCGNPRKRVGSVRQIGGEDGGLDGVQAG